MNHVRWLVVVALLLMAILPASGSTCPARIVNATVIDVPGSVESPVIAWINSGNCGAVVGKVSIRASIRYEGMVIGAPWAVRNISVTKSISLQPGLHSYQMPVAYPVSYHRNERVTSYRIVVCG